MLWCGSCQNICTTCVQYLLQGGRMVHRTPPLHCCRRPQCLVVGMCTAPSRSGRVGASYHLHALGGVFAQRTTFVLTISTYQRRHTLRYVVNM